MSETLQTQKIEPQLPAQGQQSATRAVAIWKDHDKVHRMPLSEGRYPIGNSPTSAIYLSDKADKKGIVGVIDVVGNDVSFKCVSELLPIRYLGKRVDVEEVIFIASSVELNIGKQSLRIINAETMDINEGREEIHDALESLTDDVIKDAGLLKYSISRKLIRRLNMDGVRPETVGPEKLRARARLELKGILAGLELPPNAALTNEQIEKQVLDEVVGLGPLEDLLADPTITEIMVNSVKQIYIERKGQLVTAGTAFSSEQSLLSVIERIVSTVGRRVDASSPIVDARLLDGSRVNAVIPPIALKGPCLTIRRFSKKPISVEQLVGWKSMSAFMADFLQMCVHNRMNVVISGGTGSGKTTLLNALSNFIPHDERIVTVEDAAELQLQQPHVVSLETRPPNLEGKGAITIRDLVKNCLRMRPDRIVVGECRGGEALDMLQAMNTGHDGSLTTAHANSPEDMLRRLETMVLMAGVEFPLIAIREQIASAVQVIVQQTRLHTGRRLVTYITWIHSLDRANNRYVTYDLFKFKAKEGSDNGAVNFNVEDAQKFAAHFNMREAFEKLLETYKNNLEHNV